MDKLKKAMKKRHSKTEKHIEHIEHQIHRVLTQAGPFFIIQSLEKDLTKAKQDLKDQHVKNKKKHDELEAKVQEAEKIASEEMVRVFFFPLFLKSK